MFLTKSYKLLKSIKIHYAYLINDFVLCVCVCVCVCEREKERSLVCVFSDKYNELTLNSTELECTHMQSFSYSIIMMPQLQKLAFHPVHILAEILNNAQYCCAFSRNN